MPLYYSGKLNSNITDISQVSVTTWDGEPVTPAALSLNYGVVFAEVDTPGHYRINADLGSYTISYPVLLTDEEDYDPSDLRQYVDNKSVYDGEGVKWSVDTDHGRGRGYQLSESGVYGWNTVEGSVWGMSPMGILCDMGEGEGYLVYPSSPGTIATQEWVTARIPAPPTTGTFTLRSVNGVVSWVTE